MLKNPQRLKCVMMAWNFGMLTFEEPIFLCVCRFRVPADVGLHLESSGHHLSQLHSAVRPQVPAQEVFPACLLQTHPLSCFLQCPRLMQRDSESATSPCVVKRRRGGVHFLFASHPPNQLDQSCCLPLGSYSRPLGRLPLGSYPRPQGSYSLPLRSLFSLWSHILSLWVMLSLSGVMLFF